MKPKPSAQLPKSGFKSNVQKELGASFFECGCGVKKSSWNIYSPDEQLDDDIKAELPLKRIWTVAAQEKE